MADADCAAQLSQHRRVFGQAHSGQGAEHLQVRAGNGSYVHLACDIPAAQIIPDLRVGLWVKTDRPGVQLLVRVVLPHSRRGPDNQPVTMLLRGEIAQQIGVWQRLSMRHLPLLLERQIRVLRTQFGPEIDPLGAYIDLVALNAYAGAGVTNVVVDDLEMESVVPPSAMAKMFAAAVEDGNSPPRKIAAPAALDGGVLVVEDSPLFVQAIECRGASLEEAESLAFNTVVLDDPPSRGMMQEARRLGLWLIAPPAPPSDIAVSPPPCDRVLSWRLTGLGRNDFASQRRAADWIRRNDLIAERLLASEPQERYWEHSRLADLVILPASEASFVAETTPFGQAGEAPRLSLAPSLEDKVSQLRSGAVWWAAIDIHPREPIRPASVHYAAWKAVMLGARGLVFRCSSPPGKEWSATLEWINRELARVSPWLSTSAPKELQVEGTSTKAVSFSANRSHLVAALPTPGWHGAGSALLVGVPASSEAYRVTPMGLRPDAVERGAASVRLTIDDDSQLQWSIVAQNPLAVRHLNERLRRDGRRMAELRLQIGKALLSEAQRKAAALDPAAAASIVPIVRRASVQLSYAERLLDTGDVPGCEMSAARAAILLESVER